MVILPLKPSFEELRLTVSSAEMVLPGLNLDEEIVFACEISSLPNHNCNFKARDIDFSKALQARMDVGPVSVSNDRHFKVYTGTGDEGAQFRQSVNASQDGNTVELHVEQMQFSENVMRYQTSLEFLNRKFSGLMSAIKGE